MSAIMNLGADNPNVLPLGTVQGIPIRLHPTFFALLGVSVLAGAGRGGQYVALVALLYGPILLATIVAHELGHALTARRLGAAVEAIVLWPLGGLALCGAGASPQDDIKVRLWTVGARFELCIAIRLVSDPTLRPAY